LEIIFIFRLAKEVLSARITLQANLAVD